MADDSAVGTDVWNNPGNVASSDNVYSNVNVAAPGAAETSHYLKCTNFGFAIPSGATINGVTVAIERKALTAGTANVFVKDSTIKLVKGGTVSGANKANTVTYWPTTEGSVSYGGAADLWTLTLSDTDINGSTFGVVLSVSIRDRFGVGQVGYVDLISITIDYTVGGGGGGLSIPVAMQSYRQRRV
jgi:hypothetical protein